MLPAAGAGLGQSLEPRTPFGSPTLVVGVQVLELLRVCIARKLDQKLKWDSILNPLLWNISIQEATELAVPPRHLPLFLHFYFYVLERQSETEMFHLLIHP